MSQRRAPRQAAEAFRAARERAAPRTALAATQASWRQVVGDYLAQRSTPRAERDGIVTVECSDAGLAHELEMMQGQLLERLRATLGEQTPRGLRFRIGGDPN